MQTLRPIRRQQPVGVQYLEPSTGRPIDMKTKQPITYPDEEIKGQKDT